MQKYFVRRVILMLPTIIGLTFVVFMAVRLLPGDVINQIVGESGDATPEMREALEERYNLNGNVGVRYVEWSAGLLRGDLGNSIISDRPVTQHLRERVAVTVELGILALIASQLIALPVGIISAVRQDSIVDHLARSLSILLLAVPSFWLALLAITYGFVWFGWTPPLRYAEIWDDPASNIRSLWVPALILGAALSGTLMRLTRSTVIEVLRQDYVRTARAKGLRERSTVLHHVMRNALIPVVTVIGLQVPVVVGGTVVLESIFGLPGLGSFLLDSVQHRDYPAVQGVVLISGTVVILTNLLVDLTYPLLDPRIR
ncbi:MAG: ABC transporter permease [Chloroflexi bacterium]|nr:ABC transporter permease [Chloroflexota bacterium]